MFDVAIRNLFEDTEVIPKSVLDLRDDYMACHRTQSVDKVSDLKMLCWFVKKYRHCDIFIDELKTYDIKAVEVLLHKIFRSDVSQPYGLLSKVKQAFTNIRYRRNSKLPNGHLWVALTQWHCGTGSLTNDVVHELLKCGNLISLGNCCR